MPRNNGVYTPPTNNWSPAINGRPMDPAGWNALLADIADALTNSIAKDGQTPITGPLNLNGNRLRNVGAPHQSGDGLRLSMLEKGPDLESAATLDLPMEGQLFTITGGEDITSITSQFDGKIAFLQFEQALSIIPSENLILPSESAYLTSPGETLLFLSTGPDSGFVFSMAAGGSDEDVWAAVLAI